MSHSTTAKERLKPGPKPGSKTADRRLRREIANKTALTSVATGLIELARTTVATGASNPVVGFVTGLTILGILHRVRVISTLDYAFGLAGLGLIEVSAALQAGGEGAAGIIGGVGLAIPSIGSKTLNITQPESLIATSPNVSFESRSEKPAKPVVSEKGYVPE